MIRTTSKQPTRRVLTAQLPQPSASSSPRKTSGSPLPTPDHFRFPGRKRPRWAGVRNQALRQNVIDFFLKLQALGKRSLNVWYSSLSKIFIGLHIHVLKKNLWKDKEKSNVLPGGSNGNCEGRDRLLTEYLFILFYVGIMWRCYLCKKLNVDFKWNNKEKNCS